MTYILGLNSVYHESSACLLKDGKIVAFAEEERFNRIKHSKPAKVNNPDELPTNAINFCLKQADIKLSDVNYFGYSFLPKDRLKKSIGVDNIKELPKGSWGTKRGEELFYKKIFNVPKKLSKMAGVNISKKFHFLSHHICHAASSFFVSPFKESAILVVDGIAEFASTWLGYGKDNKLHKLLEINYPNSLGFLWEKMSEYLGFTKYDGAKVMGLSSYGEAHKMMPKMKKIVKLNKDGTFEINNNIMKFRTKDFRPLEKLFGIKKREKDAHIFAVHENIAAALQEITEKAMINLARRLYKKVKNKNMCLAGGVALNCVANGKVIQNTKFENIFIQPATHDAGTALGAAYYIWNKILNKPRTPNLKDAYFGPEYSEEEIKKILDKEGILYKRVRDVEKLTALLLSKGNIIGWFQGKMEVGPRALGHRSILADPRSPVIRDELNRKVKFREIFRPFCPSVLEEDAKKWFELKRFDYPGYYMLVAYKVKHDKVDLIPAVIHVDKTARLQLVSEKISSKYYKLIKEFKKITGIPLILNTSFNIKEPIVCSPQDAIKTFKRSKMDYLIMGNFVIDHKNLKRR